MSFSYASIPPPESPPLKATPLSPAPPARTDRRTKRHTTMDISLSGLSLNDRLADDPLDLNVARRSDSTGSSNSSFSQERAKRQSTAGSIPVPKMINPLPAHYRHPSPAPSSQSSGSARASSTSTHESSASSAASIASCRSNRHSLAPKPSQASLYHDASLYTISSSDSLSSNCEPVTPTTATFSRSRLVYPPTQQKIKELPEFPREIDEAAAIALRDAEQGAPLLRDFSPEPEDDEPLSPATKGRKLNEPGIGGPLS